MENQPKGVSPTTTFLLMIIAALLAIGGTYAVLELKTEPVEAPENEEIAVSEEMDEDDEEQDDPEEDTVDETPDPPAQSSPTISTYTNKEFRFSIDYPTTWTSQDCSAFADGTKLSNVEYMQMFNIETICPLIEGGGPASSLKVAVTKTDGTEPWCKTDPTVEEITLSGQTAYKCTTSYFGTGTSLVVQLITDDYSYSISGDSASSAGQDDEQAYLEELEAAIQSFQLL